MKKNSYDIKIDIKRTLVLDDKKYTTTDNPNNAVIIPGFAPGQDENWYVKDFDELTDRSDRSLVKFTDWFRTVKDENDYTKLYKGDIFR